MVEFNQLIVINDYCFTVFSLSTDKFTFQRQSIFDMIEFKSKAHLDLKRQMKNACIIDLF